MVLEAIKKRSIKIMTHRGRILRFLISPTIKPIYLCLDFPNIFFIPNPAPAAIRNSIPVMGTVGLPLGSPGCAKATIEKEIKTKAKI